MSSYNAPRPNGSQNAGQRLPEKFRCDLGNEWKPWTSFSKRQQKKVEDKMSKRQHVDAANTGMICRVHTGEPVKEIPCEGPCGLVRVLDDFSKNNRTNGVFICKVCQHWINAQEPGYLPCAAPNTHADPLEKQSEVDGYLPTDPSEIFDFNSERNWPLAPVTGTDGVTKHPNNAANSSNVSRKATNTSGSFISDEAPSGEMAALRISPGTNVQKPAHRLKNYSAWDPTGRKHNMTKVMTEQTGRSTIAAESVVEDSVRGKPGTFGSATDRRGDRKPLTDKEQRDLQRNAPKLFVSPYDNDDDEDEDSDE